MLTIDWKVTDCPNMSVWNLLASFCTQAALYYSGSLVVKIRMQSAGFFKLFQGHVSLDSSALHWSIHSCIATVTLCGFTI